MASICCPMSCGIRRSSQEEIDRQRQQALSGLTVSYEDPDSSRASCSIGSSTGSIRTACRTPARPNRCSRSRPTTSAPFTRRDSCRTTRFSRSSATSRPTRRLPAAEKAFGDWQRGRVAAGRASGAAAADAAPRGHQQARRGADRDPRRAPRASPRTAPGLPRVRPGDEDPRRRGRQPAAPGAAVGARAHLRRVGRACSRCSRAATSWPKPTRAPTRRPKCCG